MNEKKKETLYIPSNIKVKMEFFEGFGVSELMITIISTIIISILAFIIFKNSTTAVFILMFTIALNVVLNVKDTTNQSIISFVLNFIIFLITQEKYDYKYLKEW